MFTIADHYNAGFRNGVKTVTREPQNRSWYALQARAAACGPYSSWPPFRAYQLGFARAVRG